ncbi:MAG: ABC transporter substrate-binding protein [Deltaproteobacteria bacterium]|nr:ABC transporter substrate-binding protein [Deltaproteobacteria bacterium]
MKSKYVILMFALLLLLSPKAWAVDRIRISQSAISGSQAILWVTQDAGFFRKYNLDPEIIYIAGGPPNIAALVSGDVQFTIFAGPASIAATLEGADVVVLMSFINTLEHSIFTSSGIRRPADLKGKRIGVARPGSTDDYGARVALQKWGLQADKEVALLAVGGQPSRFAALQSGRVDATLLQPPLTVAARQAGFNELAPLADLGLDYVGTCLVTTRALIQKNENLVRRLVMAFAEGIHFYKTQKEASLRFMSKFTKLKDTAALEEAYNTYAIKFMSRVPYPTLKGVETILEDLGKKNPKARGADPAAFIEPRFLKELEASGFIAQLYGK